MGKTATPSPAKASSNRVDWPALRGTIDMTALMTRLFGPAPGRRGGKGKLWWVCPFHPDVNPSFTVRPGDQYGHCFGCGWHGDAIDLVRQLGLATTFPEAVAVLTGSTAPARPAGPRPAALATPPVPSGLPADDALRLVERAAEALWSHAGAEALAYLRGRGLRDDTIRQHRLGWTGGTSYPTRSGGAALAAGVVIPWIDGDQLALLKVRQHDREPRYAEIHRDPERLTCFPGLSGLKPGLPLVAVEGELDAVLLAQELAGLANVQTLGSASTKPSDRILGRILTLPRWYAAHDADAAGDKAAAAWPSRTVRVRPPGSYKDWTEAVTLPRYPVPLRRWWTDVFAGVEHPVLYTWDELATWRWGGADDLPSSSSGVPSWPRPGAPGSSRW